MNKNVFDRRGHLTAWGLLCGYSKKRTAKDKEVQMYVENEAFYVRVSDGTNLSCKCFYTLKEANKFFKQFK